MSARTKNSVPTLMKTLRMNSVQVAARLGVNRGTTDNWHSGKYQPEPDQRGLLVVFARQQARKLLELADAVEREGGNTKYAEDDSESPAYLRSERRRLR